MPLLTSSALSILWIMFPICSEPYTKSHVCSQRTGCSCSLPSSIILLRFANQWSSLLTSLIVFVQHLEFWTKGTMKNPPEAFTIAFPRGFVMMRSTDGLDTPCFPQNLSSRHPNSIQVNESMGC